MEKTDLPSDYKEVVSAAADIIERLSVLRTSGEKKGLE
jgi:hypothetical protein